MLEETREELEALTNMVGALQQEVKYLWRLASRQREAFSAEMLDAVRRGETAAVRFLIRHGSDPSWRDEEGSSAIHLAVFYKRMEILHLLLAEGWPVDERDNRRRTPLHLAAGAGRIEALKTLLKWKARVDLPDENGHTALHMAALGGYLDVAKELLDVSTRQAASEDTEGRTPLHLAARQGNGDLVALLLEAGSNPNHRSHNRHTPLHEAAKSADETSVQALLASGSNPKVKDVLFRVPGDYVGVKKPLNDAIRERQERVKELLRKAESTAE